MPVDTTVLRGSTQSGFLAKSVAGSVDVALTTEEARNRAIQFTGAIGANVAVTLPLGAENGGMLYLLENATSGAFTLTVKGQVGTGLVITAAKRVEFLWTGADFLQWTANF